MRRRNLERAKDEHIGRSRVANAGQKSSPAAKRAPPTNVEFQRWVTAKVLVIPFES